MKFRSTLKNFEPHFIRRMLSWVAKEVGYPISQLQRADFCHTKRFWGGTSGLCYGRFRIALRAPKRDQGPNTRRGGIRCNDLTETIVYVTAHELAHALDYLTCNKTNEGSAQLQGRKVLESFRLQRDQLVAEWSAPVVEAASRPALKPEHIRAKRAEEMLARWQRKLKLASTKVNKYRRQVNSYQKKAASSPGETGV